MISTTDRAFVLVMFVSVMFALSEVARILSRIARAVERPRTSEETSSPPSDAAAYWVPPERNE